MDFTFAPLGVWPGRFTDRRRKAQFRTNYTGTLGILERELRAIGGNNVILQIALTPSEIRLDGRPRSDARPSHPGVILSFDSKHGPLSYPCDTYNSWQDNLHAIALALECLRAVDRYGVTKRGEQYRGWTALPAPDRTPTLDKMAAVKVLQAFFAPRVIDSQDTAREAYRAAVLATHPDRGGNAEEFNRVQEAKEVLGL